MRRRARFCHGTRIRLWGRMFQPGTAGFYILGGGGGGGEGCFASLKAVLRTDSGGGGRVAPGGEVGRGLVGARGFGGWGALCCVPISHHAPPPAGGRGENGRGARLGLS